ncbi:MAG TPA: prolyl oligopeptidase family serine peptidase [Chthoniobacteraceae bacterium]|nr:prolyl oligopeptidase family serine peptidase [Chthoniobacteraceae bacterium]
MRTLHALTMLLSMLVAPLLFGEEKEIDPRIETFFQPPSEFANDFGGLRSPLKFEDGTEVATADEWPQRRDEIRKAWFELMGPWPELIEKPEVEYLDKEARDNFTEYHLRIEIAPKRKADDVYLLVPEGKGPFPAVLVVFYDAKSGTGQNDRPMCDFAYQLAKRGFVTLSVGGVQKYYPNEKECQLQPLSYLAYQAANCCNLLANLDYVDGNKIGVMGHSYGGKWAMFASCLYDKFACGVWSDGGVVFDEKRANVNYWEPWYLGFEPGQAQRKEGMVTEQNPRTGAYKKMIEAGRNLQELQALMAPRPFLVSGGGEDRPHRWNVLNHAVAVNKLLGFENRVAMTNRQDHRPTPESNEQAYLFFEQFLKPPAP